MRKLRLVLVGAIAVFLCSGCAVNLPFNNRLSYPAVREAKNFASNSKGPISVKWIPPSFPERIDVQGASGFVGGGSQTRIPTGVGLANRILEALDSSVGVLESSNKTLTIEIIEAKTEFEYSAGFFNVTPAIDLGRCRLEATFTIGEKHWKEKFFSESKDPTIGGTSQTAIVEKVWDDIAIQVVRNIMKNL